MTKNVTKLIGTLAGAALFLTPVDTASAGVRDQAAILFNSTKIWAALNYNNDWVFYIDPYSLYKVNDSEWDVNITAINNMNQYGPDETSTYRINCNNYNAYSIGWRVNGVLKENKGPLGFRIARTDNFKIDPSKIMWSAKEYVCGSNNSGSTYYMTFSSFRGGQVRSTLDQMWMKDNAVIISQDDKNIRKSSLMMTVLCGNQPNFSDLYVNCSKREWMDAVNDVTTTEWSPVPATSGIEVLFEKMCSNRFSFVTYQTNSIKMPAPKPVAAPVQTGESNEQPRDRAGMEEAKRKCGDLGFRAGTPKFGQCVLRLTQ